MFAVAVYVAARKSAKSGRRYEWGEDVREEGLQEAASTTVEDEPKGQGVADILAGMAQPASPLPRLPPVYLSRTLPPAPPGQPPPQCVSIR